MGKAALAIILALASALAGCATPALQAPVAAGSALSAVSVTTTPLSVPAPYSQIPNDSCGANALGWLVGRSRADIPIPTDLSHRRVTCTTCPMSQDFRPDRLNILFDQRSGTVTKLTCG